MEALVCSSPGHGGQPGDRRDAEVCQGGGIDRQEGGGAAGEEEEAGRGGRGQGDAGGDGDSEEGRDTGVPGRAPLDLQQGTAAAAGLEDEEREKTEACAAEDGGSGEEGDGGVGDVLREETSYRAGSEQADERSEPQEGVWKDDERV
eukprot:468811-Hanusia_phi.AAC.1